MGEEIMQKKIVCIVWSSHATALRQIAPAAEAQVDIYCARDLEKQEARVLQSVGEADVLFVYRGADAVWGLLDSPLHDIRETRSVPIICVASDPGAWGLSTVPAAIVQRAYQYLTYGGSGNSALLMQLLGIILNQFYKNHNY